MCGRTVWAGSPRLVMQCLRELKTASVRYLAQALSVRRTSRCAVFCTLTRAIPRALIADLCLPQVIHYEEAQEYKPHLDAYDMNTARGQRTTAKGGQRLITTLLYLSDVIEGGGTGFPNLGVEAMPKKGRVLCFYNCESNNLKPDGRTLHCGSPVVKGTKWAANKWIRQYPMRAPRPAGA
jgi:predicted 2-oxoglutarate/Fe(II)-dependent dioxygenase YbiX